jgi:hypothetical protein
MLPSCEKLAPSYRVASRHLRMPLPMNRHPASSISAVEGSGTPVGVSNTPEDDVNVTPYGSAKSTDSVSMKLHDASFDEPQTR